MLDKSESYIPFVLEFVFANSPLEFFYVYTQRASIERRKSKRKKKKREKGTMEREVIGSFSIVFSYFEFYNIHAK